MWILQQRGDLAAEAGCGKRLTEVSVRKQTETVKSTDRGYLILTGNSKVQKWMPTETKNRRCSGENRPWKSLRNCELQREQKKTQRGCKGLGLYETKHKQNRQLVVASVHRLQDILRSAKLAEAETVDKLRQQARKKMDCIVGNLWCSAITTEAEALAVVKTTRILWAQTQRCFNISGCKVYYKVNVLGSIITTWQLQMRAYEQKLFFLAFNSTEPSKYNFRGGRRGFLTYRANVKGARH